MSFPQIRTQVGLILIFLYNILYNTIPFFWIKNFYLRLTGSKIGVNSYIHTLIRFTFPGKLVVGNNCTINFGCLLDTRGELVIGNNVMVGHNCKIYTTGHDIYDEYFKGTYHSVVIEDNVVIFPNVIIMPGVKIRENAVILNGSVVTKDISSNDIVGGNPAKVLKQRNCIPKYKLNYGYWFINS